MIRALARALVGWGLPRSSTSIPLDGGWAVAPDHRFPTPFLGRRRDTHPIQVMVIHWTVTPYPKPGTDGGSRIRRWMLGKGTRSSSHFVVLRSGTVYQSARVAGGWRNRGDRAWHAGVSEWRGMSSVNGFSFGLDLDCAGTLKKGGRNNAYGTRHKGPRVKVDGRWYEPYTEAQITAALALTAYLSRELGAFEVAGHSDLTHRKQDPGPTCPMELFREAARTGRVPEWDVADWPGVV